MKSCHDSGTCYESSLTVHRVESLNRGHFRAVSYPLQGGCPLREVENVLELYGENYGTSNFVLCREVVPVSECPISEIPL